MKNNIKLRIILVFVLFGVSPSLWAADIIMASNVVFEKNAEFKETITGYDGVATGTNSVALGYKTEATGGNSFASGKYSEASGANSTAEGYYTEATGNQSHAEGGWSKAIGHYSHAEGAQTEARSWQAHAEGQYTRAHGPQSHAEGNYSIAYGRASHAEGDHTFTSNDYAHAEGNYTKAMGLASHAAGYKAEAIHDNTFVWADGENSTYQSTTNNQFNVRAGNGFRFETDGSGGTIDGIAVATTLMPAQGDISMGSYTNGPTPPSQ